MKRFVVSFLLLALCAPGALALTRDEAAAIAREAAPGAELVHTRLDDGGYEFELRGENTRYRVDVDAATGAVLEIEAEYPSAGRGARFALSEAEARDAAAAVAPQAANGIVTRDRERGGSAYEVFYAADGAVGEVAVNAETGAILGATVYPDAAARGAIDAARVAELIAGRASGARITELELDRDGSRYRYEGEVEAGGARYSFELDANTGAFIEFERDD